VVHVNLTFRGSWWSMAWPPGAGDEHLLIDTSTNDAG
jgi:hypothetical protein